MGSIIVKYIEKNIDKICEIFFGSIYDEDEEKYADIYKYDIQEYLKKIEQSIDSIFNIHKSISNRDLKTILICQNMFYEDYKMINIEELNKFIESILTNCLLEYYSKISSEPKEVKVSEEKLTDEEEKFLKASIKFRYKNIYISLRDTILGKGVSSLKQENQEFYNDIIKDLKVEFITGTNLIYKLYAEKPQNDIIFDDICSHFDIKRNEFIF